MVAIPVGHALASRRAAIGIRGKSVRRRKGPCDGWL